ncbi:acyl-CoA dehydrogenase family protein [Neolewinella lacunae]|uniref:glutaryl-CoA dehydrogenase (ETF) n=1 Tax=Neolewinella lacunae TaxID=1517758 RepID=A0A923PJB0_9BACT|nr:acyl-CoA dehydrogenase family protein [Neolewinella lacunae]MBC6993620.1 acyl-CoA dehydrogenase family protein [Neolewinella lacunae]MDN3635526.1 acyl-CoA dehydrogenase family protein [Neolewinella lacunae]
MPTTTNLREVTTKADFHQSAREDRFQYHDYLGVDDLLEDDHKMARAAVRDWVKSEVSPIIEDAAMRGKCPTHLFKGLAEIGAFGPSLPVEYGGGGMDEIAYGVIMQELERGDSGIRSMASVQGSLVMYPIYKYASEATKKKYLPKLGSGEFIGCFGLTEPDAGSNPGSMLTNVVDDGDAYILNGAKMWITNSPVADLAVVWAKDEEGKVRGMVVEAGWKGFSAPEIHGKWSLRASVTGELVFEDVRVPKENVFPDVNSLRGPLSCLSKARYGIAWGAIGAALDCYDSALRYSQERVQFDKPIGSFQLTQKKLAEMITEISKAQLLAWRLGTLANRGEATPAQISMGKRNNVNMALQVAREARQIHGGMGITSEYPIMRHMANLESVVTYEGTHDIHLLITGMDVTGFNAFG